MKNILILLAIIPILSFAEEKDVDLKVDNTYFTPVRTMTLWHKRYNEWCDEYPDEPMHQSAIMRKAFFRINTKTVEIAFENENWAWEGVFPFELYLPANASEDFINAVYVLSNAGFTIEKLIPANDATIGDQKMSDYYEVITYDSGSTKYITANVIVLNKKQILQITDVVFD